MQKYIEDPLSEALIQGTLPRPSELEVYLGDTGIYYRQVNAEGEAAVDRRRYSRRTLAGNAAVHVLRTTVRGRREPEREQPREAPTPVKQ